jgi:hypothetical protein
MKRILTVACAAVFLHAATASAVPNFSDTFEPPTGVSGAVWTPWSPAAPAGINNLVITSSSHNITPGGSQSAQANASDPAAWNGYADFGAYDGYIQSSVYVFEDLSNPGSGDQPVTNMFALLGDSGTGPGAFTDYLQLGVVPFFPGGTTTYGFRTRYNDATGSGIIDTGVARKAGWTKLGIEVDPLSAGGAVRFYVDDVLEGSSFRAGANGGAGGLSPVDMRWVRIGNNSKTYENFWYDDVKVVPEPSSVLMLGLGGAGLLGIALRRRRI